MNIFRKIILAAVALIAPMTMSFAEVTTDQMAPDFTLTDTNGKTHKLSDHKGQYVVLEWFNYDCPFVVKHYASQNMQNLQKEFTGKGVAWLSINSSAPGKQGAYAAEEMNKLASERGAAATAILLDADGTVGKLYGAKTTPHMYIIDPQGKLIYQGAIDDNPSAEPADAATAKNYVREALNQAMNGQPVAENTTKSYGCSVKY